MGHSLFRITLCGVLFAALSINILAQSLYGTGISPDDGLLRIFNYSDDEQSMEIGSRIIFSEGDSTVTPYTTVIPGMHFLEYNEEWYELLIEPGKFYTVVIGVSELQVFKDTKHTDPAKAQIYLYNLLTDDVVSLFADPGQISVISDVEGSSSKQVAVNPVAADFKVIPDESEGLIIGTLPLTRGGSVAIFIYDKAGVRYSVIAEARVSTE